MALVIYDQGYRIQTPVTALLSPRGVEQLTELQRSRGIPSSEDQALPPAATEGQRRFVQAQRAYRQTERLATQAQARPPIPVEKIMTSPVFTISAGSSITEAWQLLDEHQVRHLAVINDEGRLYGVISEYDLLRRSALVNVNGPTRAQLSIDGAYSTQLIVATPDTEVRQVALTFIERRIGCMPVLDDEGDLVGIVTRTDLLHLITNDLQSDRWA